jgi:hypothetical protein
MHDTVIKKTNMFIFSPCLLLPVPFQSNYIKDKHKYTYMNQLLSRFITTSGPTNKLAEVIKFHVLSLLYGILSTPNSIKIRITVNVKQEIKIIFVINYSIHKRGPTRYLTE